MEDTDDEILGLEQLPQTGIGALARAVLVGLPFNEDPERVAAMEAAHPGIRWVVVATRLRGVTPPLRITSVTDEGPGEIRIGLLDPTGTDWQLTVWTHDEDATLKRVMFGRPLAEGIRIDTAIDDPPMRDILALESAVAIEAGDNVQTIDRTHSLEAHLRMVDRVYTAVAYEGDLAVAMTSSMFRSVPDRDGSELTIVYAGRDRVHPAHRGRRLTDSLRSNPHGNMPAFDGQYLLIDPENKASMARVTSAFDPFAEVVRAALPVAELAGPRIGRRAAPEDCDHIHALLQATHGRAFLWRGDDTERLRSRVSRSPAYGWGSFTFTDRAAIGVWQADERRTFLDADGRGRTVRRAHVLDHAAADDGIADFQGLLRAACADLQAQGLDEVVVTLDAQSDLVDAVTSLARSTERLLAFTPDLQVPGDLDDRGVWFDPLYV